MLMVKMPMICMSNCGNQMLKLMKSKIQLKKAKQLKAVNLPMLPIIQQNQTLMERRIRKIRRVDSNHRLKRKKLRNLKREKCHLLIRKNLHYKPQLNQQQKKQLKIRRNVTKLRLKKLLLLQQEKKQQIEIKNLILFKYDIYFHQAQFKFIGKFLQKKFPKLITTYLSILFKS